jgi:hypothetical protein
MVSSELWKPLRNSTNYVTPEFEEWRRGRISTTFNTDCGRSGIDFDSEIFLNWVKAGEWRGMNILSHSVPHTSCARHWNDAIQNECYINATGSSFYLVFITWICQVTQSMVFTLWFCNNNGHQWLQTANTQEMMLIIDVDINTEGAWFGGVHNDTPPNLFELRLK